MIKKYIRPARTWVNHILPSYWTFEEDARFRHLDSWRCKLALFNAFVQATSYRTWDSWSLHPDTCYWIANLIMSERIHHVIEFGAGFSTIFLDRFIRDLKLDITVESFEHQSNFNSRLQRWLEGSTSTSLHFCKLWQASDQVFQRMFESPDDSYATFAQLAKEVPVGQYHETRLRNVFYGYDFSQIASKSIDLLILDGPNGNGRSLAFPLLKEKLANPCWIVVDDYLDYPFLDDLRRVSHVEIMRRREIAGNEFVVAKTVAS
ncbi:MAG: class I SAM-dependent methyltransferase [Caldilineaceae bacterium]|nr:class I SAM-dependent methyltransferase [Caldilineaceae bacterium]